VSVRPASIAGTMGKAGSSSHIFPSAIVVGSILRTIALATSALAVVPRNNGERPAHDLVDVRYRNGVVSRGIDPKKRRWEPWDFESEWDIAEFQVSKGE